ncbi:MAG TPA: amidophosphoribosyltransferase, partial [Acidobacteria bacterium]|nr:amidophosphoribosyltransferase [Acidobacteriota bacterium]
RVSDQISDYWVAFATNGNPNRDGLPAWPGYDAERQAHQIIGAEVTQGTGFRRAELDAMDRYFAETYAGAKR